MWFGYENIFLSHSFPLPCIKNCLTRGQYLFQNNCRNSTEQTIEWNLRCNKYNFRNICCVVQVTEHFSLNILFIWLLCSDGICVCFKYKNTVSVQKWSERGNSYYSNESRAYWDIQPRKLFFSNQVGCFWFHYIHSWPLLSFWCSVQLVKYDAQVGKQTMQF